MSWEKYFKMGFGGDKDGSTYVPGWQPGDNGYAPMPSALPPAWTVTTTTYSSRVHYHAARPGKRWK